jgi:glycosyltransferase involved in cell wall biosynthesis
LGLAKQLNFAVNNAKGKYIARMDADDFCSGQRLAKQFYYLENNKEIDVLGSNYYLLKDSTAILKKLPEYHDEIEYMMPVLTCLIHPSLFVSRSLLLDVGLYNESLDYSEDHDLFLRMLLNGYKFYNIQEPLVTVRFAKTSYLQLNLTKHKRQHYANGRRYLEEKYRTKDGEHSHDYYYRAGLLEYYSDNIKEARKYLLNALKLNVGSSPRILRYLLPTFMGERLFLALRRRKIFSRLNTIILNKLKVDTHKIKKIR